MLCSENLREKSSLRKCRSKVKRDGQSDDLSVRIAVAHPIVQEDNVEANFSEETSEILDREVNISRGVPKKIFF